MSPGSTSRTTLLRMCRRVLRVARREYAEWRELCALGPTLDKVQPLTMLPRERLVHLGRLVHRVISDKINGDFVECGAWRGGSSFLMADLLRRAGVEGRKVWLFDSFEGHRPPQEIDGPAALRYAQETDSPYYFDNARVPLEDVQCSALTLGLDSYTELVKGWFDQTLATTRDRVGPIALLRVDCDWYASVRCCLEELYDQVVEGGFVVFDDYFDYDGCAIAAFEFLGKRRLAHRLQTENGIAFFQKL